LSGPKVSVVVPAFNQSGFLREALTSALTQSMTDLEVIVVDDGSTDDTRAVCASFSDPRLRYVYQPNDGTMGIGARNHAMLMAQGEWIAPLDQDDRWAADKLRRQLAAVAGDAVVGAVFCRVRFIGASGEATGEQAGPLPHGDVLHLLLAANRYYVSSGMFRRALLPKMGMPNESVSIGDWYLWLSVARHAHVAVLDDVLADYRLHPQGFQVAQRSAGDYRFWFDHWRFAQAASTRVHPDCRECQQALSTLRRTISDQQLQVARNAWRRGDFSATARQALGCAWRARPTWLGEPVVAWRRAMQLARAAARGAWARMLS
jgi:glycosyltransferase involved in cell wall biosynthesis